MKKSIDRQSSDENASPKLPMNSIMMNWLKKPDEKSSTAAKKMDEKQQQQQQQPTSSTVKAPQENKSQYFGSPKKKHAAAVVVESVETVRSPRKDFKRKAETTNEKKPAKLPSDEEDLLTEIKKASVWDLFFIT